VINERLNTFNKIRLEGIQSSIEANLERFWKRPKTFIKMALGDLKPSINLSIVRNSNGELIDDIKSISDEIHNHFSNLLKSTKFNLEKNGEWNSWYAPIENFKEKTNHCGKPIVLEELDHILKSLPTGKIPGESGHTYEIYSKLGLPSRKILLSLFNNILETTTIPTFWKSSVLVLLPKKIVWSHCLTDTRPISLIESSQKIFTKIINDKLSTTLAKEEILSKSSFAGLKGQSVMEPLSIAESTLDQARNLRKELWFASFDIAKAFDSVNLASLGKALDRIHIPKKLKKIMLRLLNKRFLRVNTEEGLTERIIASKGLDQGEVLSPILWAIFYDPLIARIAKYSNNVTSVLAYMDDLALLEENFNQLQSNTDIFQSFLNLNSIKCNASKTKVICTLYSTNIKRNKTWKIGGIEV
jgi:hypothetical protein